MDDPASWRNAARRLSLAEVIGTALALRLLLGIPLPLGALLTVLDVLLVLMLQSRGFRWLEAFVIALFINAAVLTLAAAARNAAGQTHVAEIQDAYQLLAPTLRVAAASTSFALALLASGQNATVTATRERPSC